jgi:hypothetical protein
MTETAFRFARRSTLPAAVIDATPSSIMPEFVARCACGWNAVTIAPTIAEAEANLKALQHAHRQYCPRAREEAASHA